MSDYKSIDMSITWIKLNGNKCEKSAKVVKIVPGISRGSMLYAKRSAKRKKGNEFGIGIWQWKRMQQ